MPRYIPRLRWWIGGLLFLSTVINYIDRQTLSVLAPQLKLEYGWSNQQFSLVLIAFRAAYSIGQTIAGRIIDVLGTRGGLTVSVAWYSIAAMITSLANGLWGLATCRFLLGFGEAGNWPGATKATSEWFPRRETGWAVALFDSGSSVGGALAPLIVFGLVGWFGSWRPAFIVTGMLGFVWLLLFRALYDRPETHPRLSPAERELILRGREDTTDTGKPLSYATLLRLPQTWGYVVSKAFTDPVWFFVTDWFAIYLVSRGFSVEQGALGFLVPFLAADLGNFFGGGVSSILIARGWGVGAARKVIAVLGGLGMMLLIPAAWTNDYWAIIGYFAIATFSYAAFSTIILNLPADVFPTRSVASVSGMGGTAAGLGTIAAIYLTGWVADRYSFEPILFGASFVPLVAVAAVLLLIRNNDATRAGVVKPV